MITLGQPKSDDNNNNYFIICNKWDVEIWSHKATNIIKLLKLYANVLHGP